MFSLNLHLIFLRGFFHMYIYIFFFRLIFRVIMSLLKYSCHFLVFSLSCIFLFPFHSSVRIFFPHAFFFIVIDYLSSYIHFIFFHVSFLVTFSTSSFIPFCHFFSCFHLSFIHSLICIIPPDFDMFLFPLFFSLIFFNFSVLAN